MVRHSYGAPPRCDILRIARDPTGAGFSTSQIESSSLYRRQMTRLGVFQAIQPASSPGQDQPQCYQEDLFTWPSLESFIWPRQRTSKRLLLRCYA
jgi:hypothetical protein